MDVTSEIDKLAKCTAELKILAQDDLQRHDLDLIAASIQKFRLNWAERLPPETITPQDRDFLVHKLRTPFNTIVGLSQPGIIEGYQGLDDTQTALYNQIYLTGLAILDYVKSIYTIL
ncbi:MAG: hypothetical protein D6711_08020 [Chloroflexi bacterium]|nr:MAG: hypothetical protein D6711_08020 [Chloroflexota bacterium]